MGGDVVCVLPVSVVHISNTKDSDYFSNKITTIYSFYFYFVEETTIYSWLPSKTIYSWLPMSFPP